MKHTINTDLWGAAIMFLFAGGFYSQMDPDFTHFAAYFPNRLIPCLAILGLALLIKGFVRPTRLPAFYHSMNSTFLFTVAVGLVWVFTLDWLGFALTSFVAIFALLFRFQPPERRSFTQLSSLALLAAVEVGVVYFLFTGFLQVSLPEGRLFY